MQYLLLCDQTGKATSMLDHALQSEVKVPIVLAKELAVQVELKMDS
jgi:hypothetical protein